MGGLIGWRCFRRPGGYLLVQLRGLRQWLSGGELSDGDLVAFSLFASAGNRALICQGEKGGLGIGRLPVNRAVGLALILKIEAVEQDGSDACGCVTPHNIPAGVQ